MPAQSARLRFGLVCLLAMFASVDGIAAQQLRTSKRPTVTAPPPATLRVLPRTVSSSIWTPLGTSRGKRPIRGSKTGAGKFRVLVVGSLAGSDPASVALVDQLGLSIAKNAPIIGGFRSIIIRSGNPDGIALRRTTNASGIKIATAFPTNQDTEPKMEPEVRYLVELVRTYKPHRVIHITRGSAKEGLVLHNEAGRSAGKDLAEWLSTKTRPAARFTPRGSMERFIDEAAEVVTLVLPKDTTVENVWQDYGDSVSAILAPNAPQEEWPPPTAWNQPGTTGARVFRSGVTKDSGK